MKYFFRDSCSFLYTKTPLTVSDPVFEKNPKRVNNLKGQLQRFDKLISIDRIWPSKNHFEVIFEKFLLLFEISAFKVRN